MADAKTALLVASSEYVDPRFSRLRAPAHDVEALSRVLGDPEIGAFEVRTLVNQQSWAITEEIEDFFADRRREDLLLLYFSCHGVKDVSGRLYFAAANTRFQRLGSTGISATWVNEQIDRSLSRRIVLLLDCCYSGAFARGLAPRAATGVEVMEQLDGRGRAVITASDAMEYAYEGDDLALDAGKPSIFTRALVEGLETGQADRDGDGRVAIDELYSYLYDRVRQTTPSQTPTISTIGLQGELYLARNPNPPPAPIEPAPLPFELRQAVESEIAWQRSGAVAGLKRLIVSARPELALTATYVLKDLAADDDADVREAATVALEGAADGVDTRLRPEQEQALQPAEQEQAPQPAEEETPRLVQQGAVDDGWQKSSMSVVATTQPEASAEATSIQAEEVGPPSPRNPVSVATALPAALAGVTLIVSSASSEKAYQFAGAASVGLALLGLVFLLGAFLVGTRREEGQVQLGHELLIAAAFPVFVYFLSLLLTYDQDASAVGLAISVSVGAFLAAAMSLARLLQLGALRWGFTPALLGQALVVVALLGAIAVVGTRNDEVKVVLCPFCYYPSLVVLISFLSGTLLLIFSFLEPVRLLALTLMTWTAVWLPYTNYFPEEGLQRWLLVGLGIVGAVRLATAKLTKDVEPQAS